MTLKDRAALLTRFGYTEREATFLAAAALHSGYFLMRQFSVKGGKVADRFAKKLANYGHATVRKCANNTSLFHVQSKAIYRALDQENNRHRRAHHPYHVRSKVMGLDYVLQHPDHRFLPTEAEKLSYFQTERQLPKSLFPAKIYAGRGLNTERFFIDKYPIGIRNPGKVVFCFVDDGAFGGLGFPTWLTQYDALIRELGSGAEVVYISPDKFTFEVARRQFGDHFAGPAGTGSEELKTYFELRKDFEVAGLRGRSQAVLDTMKRLRKTFQGDRFEVEYAAWISAGSQPIPAGPSMILTTHHLNHSYRFFGVKA